ncbi:MAG: hypothetical protein SFY81_15550 [Verrucomicrobiota bacterium]|nr:hypothetical protein [Verrucomicrobiota bacterium]
MMRLFTSILFLTGVLISSVAQAQSRPDLGLHKAAMEKLKFLTGKWRGDAIITPGDGPNIKFSQTEEVQYKLDGTIMTIEGTGRDETGKTVFNAFAIVSYDPQRQAYRICAWNSGHYIESELKVGDKTFEWGFQQGPLKSLSQMKVDADGNWSEASEVTLSDGRKLHSVTMLLKKQ